MSLKENRKLYKKISSLMGGLCGLYLLLVVKNLPFIDSVWKLDPASFTLVLFTPILIIVLLNFIIRRKILNQTKLTTTKGSVPDELKLILNQRVGFVYGKKIRLVLCVFFLALFFGLLSVKFILAVDLKKYASTFLFLSIFALLITMVYDRYLIAKVEESSKGENEKLSLDSFELALSRSVLFKHATALTLSFALVGLLVAFSFFLFFK